MARRSTTPRVEKQFRHRITWTYQGGRVVSMTCSCGAIISMHEYDTPEDAETHHRAEAYKKQVDTRAGRS